MRKAFTLIELLIVVAIIAILAAIAVPNFLEAQTRAKVSRAKNDERTCALGIEAYMVDENDIPPSANETAAWGSRYIPASVTEETGAALDLKLEAVTATTGSSQNLWRLRTYQAWTWLTTPIGYVQHTYIDPFSRVVPLSYDTKADTVGRRALAWIGSAGPSKQVMLAPGPKSRPTLVMPNCLYDSSNGTTSLGEILRPAGIKNIGYAKSYYGDTVDFDVH
ncbi:prepilin-type N-terminal cleavage/methylation domain-containing protein [Candidatus Sumerlaeota bacterium]|nr:prepilin-type N-terminal cleavage/methylation domain-containing protein [Candidatus Sumerlaeota bacterium]